MKINVENYNVVSTLSNVVQFNAENHNVVSTLLNIVNFNVDVFNVVSTLIWRCGTSRRHINLKAKLNWRRNVCWAFHHSHISFDHFTFYVIILPRRLTVVALNFFIWNIISTDISKGFIQKFHFCINRKIFKCFRTIKTGYCFFDIFMICLAGIPYFVEINWWEGYANVNLTKNNIAMEFFKNRDINSMFGNCICISTKYKIDTWVIYNMSRFINNLWISRWWCKRVKFLTCWVGNIIFPPVWTKSIKISCDNWTNRNFFIYIAKK